ncbi:MAG: YceI family protein, partial [Bacteroidota bacterium]
QDLATIKNPIQGFVPEALPANVKERSWAALGWELDETVVAQQAVATFAAPVAIGGTYRAALTTEDTPGLFFSFPAPLDRYSGEVRELTVDFNFSATGDQVSGQVELPVSSIKTSSGSLDTYVLGDILKSKRYPTARLDFAATTVPGEWRAGQALAMEIPATLTMRGKTTEVIVSATFTPGADGSLETAADFGIHFGNVFGMDAPDGPEAIRNQLHFTARFTAIADNRAR